jgi:sterol desaturase/sphingolipid hydroxylase (fatty acid hydroxylase superfamily)
MDDLLGYFGIAALGVVTLVERISLRASLLPNKRDQVFIFFGATTYLVKYLFGAFILVNYVNFLAPFQILSISELEIPDWYKLILGILALDFLEYWSHRLGHMIGPIWRLHRLHHSDKRVDTLTTLLHHPLEVLYAVLFISAGLVIFDVPLISIIVYASIVGLIGVLSHTRLLLSDQFNRLISGFIVTPNFHKVHHSINYSESNKNFGLVFTIWDRIFLSYEFKSQNNLLNQLDGVDNDQGPEKFSITQYLINPVKKRSS